jgi:hypothetical protein
MVKGCEIQRGSGCVWKREVRKEEAVETTQHLVTARKGG